MEEENFFGKTTPQEPSPERLTATFVNNPGTKIKVMDWEVGASGRRYSREFVWSVVAERLATLDVDPFVSEGWQVTESTVSELAPSTYLLTYTLIGQGRRTRRTTIWQGSAESGWTALFHQGTVVAPE